MKKLVLVLAIGLNGLFSNAMELKPLDNHKYNVGDTINLSSGSNSNIYLAVKSSEIKNDNVSYKGIIKARPQLKVVITKVYINDDNKLCFEAKDENNVYYNIDVNRALLLEEIKSNKNNFKLTKDLLTEYREEIHGTKCDIF